MKRNKNIIFLLTYMLILLYACNDDERGQYPIDSVAPAKVTSAWVEKNTPGGAVKIGRAHV